MELSLRLSTDDLEFDDVIELIDPLCDRYIIALEYAQSRHFQCYMRYIQDDDLKYSKLRYMFKSKGFVGNGKISITKMRGDNLMVYCLKDGEYKYKGFTEEEIQELSSKAYEKPMSYKARKKQINEDWFYSEKPLSMEEKTAWLTSRIQLCIEFDMGYNRRKLKEDFDTLLFSRFPDQISLECEKFFS